jgi:hypothetical protein
MDITLSVSCVPQAGVHSTLALGHDSHFRQCTSIYCRAPDITTTRQTGPALRAATLRLSLWLSCWGTWSYPSAHPWSVGSEAMNPTLMALHCLDELRKGRQCTLTGRDATQSQVLYVKRPQVSGVSEKERCCSSIRDKLLNGTHFQK